MFKPFILPLDVFLHLSHYHNSHPDSLGALSILDSPFSVEECSFGTSMDSEYALVDLDSCSNPPGRECVSLFPLLYPARLELTHSGRESGRQRSAAPENQPLQIRYNTLYNSIAIRNHLAFTSANSTPQSRIPSSTISIQ